MFERCKMKLKQKKKIHSDNYKIYIGSLKKSKDAINNCTFNASLIEYNSTEKVKKFIDNCSIYETRIVTYKDKGTNERNASIGANIRNGYSEINASFGSHDSKSVEKGIEYSSQSIISDIRNYLNSNNNNIDNCFDVKAGNYFKIRFPVYGGRICSLSKKYPSIYVWTGRYRNVEIFLCGNIKNVDRENCKNFDEYTWNPSNLGASEELLEEIEKYVLNNKKIEGDINFQNLENNIKPSTARMGTKNFGWKDILAICDKKEITKDGMIRILGSPVIVTANTDCGYGWYNINKKYYCDNFEFFEYDGNNFTGKILKKNQDSKVISDYKDLVIDIQKDYHEIYNKIKIKSEVENCRFETSRIDPVFSYYIKKGRFNDNEQTKLKSRLYQCEDIIGVCITNDLLNN